MHPRQMLRALERAMPKGAMVSTDIGNICSVSNSYLRFDEPRSMLAAMSFGNCGYAFPVACGAKVARPDRPAIAYVGDGAWGISLNELLTCAREKIGVTVVVFNNGQWGAEKKNHVDFYSRRYQGVELVNPSWAAVAKSFGCEGVVVDKVGDVGAALHGVGEAAGRGPDHRDRDDGHQGAGRPVPPRRAVEAGAAPGEIQVLRLTGSGTNSSIPAEGRASEMASINHTYSGVCTQMSGRRSSRRSRSVPPPKALANATEKTPTMSMRLRVASRMPDSAKATVAATSIARMTTPAHGREAAGRCPAHDQGRGHLLHARHALAREPREEPPAGLAADLRGGHATVVRPGESSPASSMSSKPDDRHLRRDLDAPVAAFEERADGERVVAADHGGEAGRALQELRERRAAVGDARRSTSTTASPAASRRARPARRARPPGARARGRCASCRRRSRRSRDGPGRAGAASTRIEAPRCENPTQWWRPDRRATR